ncbi:MAG TPA: hypothetical protein VFT88_05580 [Acidobacteriaceae bacterium]|nr:hypothetical protein [Acidobacteriaceae bacterium]
MQCIEISGADARAFAQAQFSGDVRALQAGHWQWNAWLDPKGSVRALMHLADLGDGRLLALLRGGDAPSLCDSLRPYVFRSKVSLRATSGWHLLAGAELAFGTIQSDPDSIGFGRGDRSLWLRRNSVPKDENDQEALRLADIRNGWPTLPPGDHAFLPPALGLEHLGAVSFGKGCYPGQEIAARLHYRGGHKLRLAHLRSGSELVAGQPMSPAQPRAIVLDAITTDGACEALAVLEENAGSLQGIEIIRRFDA